MREAGAACALTTEPQLVSPQADPFSWGRFTVVGCDTPATLMLKLNGWYSALRGGWRWLRRLRKTGRALCGTVGRPAGVGASIVPPREQTDFTMKSIAESNPGPFRAGRGLVARGAERCGVAVRRRLAADGAGRACSRSSTKGWSAAPISSPRLIIARTCSQDELGVYALAWTVVLFLAAVQGNLITVPYTMYCHRRSGEALAEYAGSTLAHQMLTSLAAVACFLGLNVLLSLGFGPEGLRPAAWVLLGVIPFLLLREYARRFTFAHLALATAITIDVVVAVLQVGSLLVLRRLGLLSAAAAYGVMGAACAVACLCWWLLDSQPMRFSAARFFADWRRNWSFGRWALTEPTDGPGRSTSCPGSWRRSAARRRPANWPPARRWSVSPTCSSWALNNLLMPKAARAFANGGPHGAGPRAAQGDAICQRRARRVVRGPVLRRQSPGRDRLRGQVCRHGTADHHARPGRVRRRDGS